MTDYSNEPLLCADDRTALYPIKYPEIFEEYKTQLAMFWTPAEINLTGDLNDWAEFTKEEKHFIKMILAFFASSDLIVNENIELNFKSALKPIEVTMLYTFQQAMEHIHTEVYSNLIEAYADNETEKLELFAAISDNSKYPVIAEMAQWARRWMQTPDITQQLFAFSAYEGILFSGPFLSIFWVGEQKKGKMNGLRESNDLISRDESRHVASAKIILQHFTNSCSAETRQQIVAECVELSTKLTDVALPCSLVGMNKADMATYIKFVADRHLVDFGCEKLYNVGNPFPFMDKIALRGKKNFFERKPNEYTIGTSMASMDNDYEL